MAGFGTFVITTGKAMRWSFCEISLKVHSKGHDKHVIFYQDNITENTLIF